MDQRLLVRLRCVRFQLPIMRFQAVAGYRHVSVFAVPSGSVSVLQFRVVFARLDPIRRRSQCYDGDRRLLLRADREIRNPSAELEFIKELKRALTCKQIH